MNCAEEKRQSTNGESDDSPAKTVVTIHPSPRRIRWAVAVLLHRVIITPDYHHSQQGCNPWP